MLNSILLLIAGLGVFLFATKLLSEKLVTLGGNKMRKKINQFSSNRFKAIGFGFALTTVFQSSTASIVMISSFTSLGLLSLFQAISLIIGANVASALPGYLISFQSFGITTFFCALAGVGALIFVFAKKTWLKNMAQAILAFGLMFVGLMIMKDSMNSFLTEPSFISFFATITNPVLLILLGTGFTILVQSSLGTVAIVLSLIGTASVAGVLPVSSAVYVIYGANLGTAITTAIVCCLSSNLNGKRAAIFHVSYALVGCIIFGLLGLTPWVEVCFGWIADPSFRVITVNLVFNLVVGLLAMPFVKYISIGFSRLIKPIKRKKVNPLATPDYNDEPTPVAIATASSKALALFYESKAIFDESINFVFAENNKRFKKLVARRENFKNYLAKLNTYITSINNETNEEGKDVEKLSIITKHLERINHNCKRIIVILNGEKKVCFSIKLEKFLTKITKNIEEMFEICQMYVQNLDCAFLKKDTSSYERILNLTKQNSETKLSAKTYVIENVAKSRAGNEKNTIYIEVINYLNMISNNLADIVFDFGSNTSLFKSPEFEQLSLHDLV